MPKSVAQTKFSHLTLILTKSLNFSITLLIFKHLFILLTLNIFTFLLYSLVFFLIFHLPKCLRNLSFFYTHNTARVSWSNIFSQFFHFFIKNVRLFSRIPFLLCLGTFLFSFLLIFLIKLVIF